MLKCGLLGEKLGHSYSPQIHSLLGNYEYRLYEKSPSEIEDFLKNGEWEGLNVTIPYKKAVIPFCSRCSDAVRKTGSANTLKKMPDGSIYADNTDVYGFSSLLDKNGIDPAGSKALILGNGGACVSVKAVLEERGAEVVVISRRGENNYENLFLNRDARLIVNTTPVGMFPNNGKAPVNPEMFEECTAVLDIIYNPRHTALTMKAQELGMKNDTGLHMLAAQAIKSSQVFTGTEIPEKRIFEIENILLHQMQNIILIGMPGSGKTTIASKLAQQTQRPVMDLDEEFERINNCSPEEFIIKYGEEAFRIQETKVIEEAGKLSGYIISTGGGCVTRPENYPCLHQNGVIVWIERDIDKLPDDGRPVSKKTGIRALYQQRKPLYERFADISVENNDPSEAAGKILDFIS